MNPKAVAFVAVKSGTGKTTLLTQVIAELKKRGRKVGALKHASEGFEMDHPGKDSHRMTVAGADTVVVRSNERIAMIKSDPREIPVTEIIKGYFGDVDIVLVEGFRKSDLPKIEVHRANAGTELLCRGEKNDPCLVAVASDLSMDLDVPVLDLNRPWDVADFIEKKFL